MYPTLNLPKANLKLKDNTIWDVLRKKYVKHTPEEWVRQHYIHYMVNVLNYPLSLMASEKLVKYNNMSKRCDIVAFSNQLNTLIIVECKAPKIKLTADTFYQISKYNFTLNSPLLILTNGLEHIVAQISPSENEIIFLDSIPSYQENLKLMSNL
jgi:hypothetical protein